MLDTTTVIGWAIIGVAALVWELRGVFNRKKRGDTLSEIVWWVEARSILAWFLLAGGLVWLLVHFLGFGEVDDMIRRIK